MSIFSALSAFPVTPADSHGQVDCNHLARLVERLAASKVSSIGVLGSTGCYMYLPLEQRRRALESAIEAAGSTPVVASVGAMRTSDVCELITHAERAGAKGILLAPVSYLPLTEADVTSLFEDASSSTDLPICFYNNPGTTHFTLSENLLVQLAQKKLIAAVKNPPPADSDFAAQMARLSTDVPEDFSLGYSGDAKITAALKANCDSWYSVLAGTLPSLAVKLWDAREDHQRLEELDTTLAPLWSVFNSYGSIRVIYEATGMLGLGSVQLPKPLLPLESKACEEIEFALSCVAALNS